MTGFILSLHQAVIISNFQLILFVVTFFKVKNSSIVMFSTLSCDYGCNLCVEMSKNEHKRHVFATTCHNRTFSFKLDFSAT